MSAVSVRTEDLLRVAQAFPATSQILAEIGRVLRNPSANLDDVVTPVKRDSALVSRLMRIANSAALAQSEPVASIEDAAALIGLSEIHRLVGALAVEHLSDATFHVYGFSGRRLRENALLVALLMEELAVPAQEDAHAAYTIGLLRSLGKITFEQLASEGALTARFTPFTGPSLVDWEQETFGLGSAEATAVVLQHWRFPHEIPKAIAEHYSPAGRSHPLSHLLHLAAHLADKLGYGLPGENAYWIDSDEIHRKSGVDPRAAKRHIDRAFISFDRLCRALA